MSADKLALSGGTSIIDPTLITALLTGIAAILSAAGGIAWANRQNRKKRPLDSADLYVTCAQCAEHRTAITKRIDELGPALNRIFQKLDTNDKRSEERAQQMHKRVDPLIEKLAETKGRVDAFEETIKDAWRASTVGGQK